MNLVKKTPSTALITNPAPEMAAALKMKLVKKKQNNGKWMPKIP